MSRRHAETKVRGPAGRQRRPRDRQAVLPAAREPLVDEQRRRERQRGHEAGKPTGAERVRARPADELDRGAQRRRRKKIQAKVTSANTTTPASTARPLPRALHARRPRDEPRNRLSTTRYVPWRPPHTTNVQLAPCQRPTSRKVTSTLKAWRQAPHAAAAEGDVDVVAHPARQGHVPAPPEHAYRDREVGIVEVLREAQVEELGGADGDVGVAREVAVDLDRVENGGDRPARRRRTGRCCATRSRPARRCCRR